MLKRRISGLLMSASTLMFVLGVSAPAVAHADTIPLPYTDYEIFPPYITPGSPKCLDVPNSSRDSGVQLVIYHCHGFAPNGANQLWNFYDQGGGNFLIVNVNSGWCVSFGDGTFPHVIQASCGGPRAVWQMPQNELDPQGFRLVSASMPGYWLTTYDKNGVDGAGAVLFPCTYSTTSDPLFQAQDFRLG